MPSGAFGAAKRESSPTPLRLIVHQDEVLQAASGAPASRLGLGGPPLVISRGGMPRKVFGGCRGHACRRVRC